MEEFMKLKKRMDVLENTLPVEKPYYSVCVYRSYWNITNKYNFEEPVSFDSVLHISTNMGEGGLDTCTGEFEAGVSGIYSISWSFSSEQANCGLKKLERRENYVRETGIGGTYSDQSKSLLMLLLERGNIIQLECSSRSKIEKNIILYKSCQFP